MSLNFNFPTLPGVYLFKDKKSKVIYVGKAKSLKKRILSYFKKPPSSPKIQAIISNYNKIDFIVTSSELEALLLESDLIKKYKPKYNVQWRDDKNYPYIKLTIQEDWPRLVVVRRKENDNALYFGPYESRSVKETLRLIGKLFPIRKCKISPLKKRNQPCLNYHIKRCWGPCIGNISNERYRALCEAIASLLSGNLSNALDYLKAEMEKASNEHNFEQAAKLRDRILNLSRMQKEKPSWMPKAKEQNFNLILEELGFELKLPKMPYRIEGFDVSNISGKETVASLVVFEGAEPLKDNYRKFIIKSVKGANDVASIYEAVYRRFSGFLKDSLKLPDLILIDGGQGQVVYAKKALTKAKINIPVIGLAKKEEIIYFPNKRNPIKLDDTSNALRLLKKIRDEAHRFAISFHRERRLKNYKNH